MPGLFDGTPLERPVTCAACGEAIEQCRCAKGADGTAIDPTKLAPRVRREKRRGKWCTVVAEHGLSQDDAKALLKELRTTLGTGGGLGDADAAGVQIVLQGDHRDAVVRALIEKGFRAKAAGG
ncbi:MAG: translation initiation factor [Phycisphaerales bacterium JB064]